jgi:hypothetical protein
MSSKAGRRTSCDAAIERTETSVVGDANVCPGVTIALQLRHASPDTQQKCRHRISTAHDPRLLLSLSRCNTEYVEQLQMKQQWQNRQ